MHARTLAAVALAALVLMTGAAAATPGNAGGTDDGGDAGPPDTLPGPVPDFVGDIHDAISSFLNGGLDALGETVSNIANGNANDAADT